MCGQLKCVNWAGSEVAVHVSGSGAHDELPLVRLASRQAASWPAVYSPFDVLLDAETMADDEERVCSIAKL